MVTDSSDIVDYLKAKHGDRLDAGLTPQQRAIGVTNPCLGRNRMSSSRYRRIVCFISHLPCFYRASIFI